MKTEHAHELLTKYPKLFSVSPEREKMPFPMFGFEVGDGWYNIIDQLCFQIQNHIDWHNGRREKLLEKNPYNSKIPDEISQVVVDQVKEKFGTLRFYASGGDDFTAGMIRMAEAMSSVTCETCGAPGMIRGRSWLYTACDLHTKEEHKI